MRVKPHGLSVYGAYRDCQCHVADEPPWHAAHIVGRGSMLQCAGGGRDAALIG